MTNDHHPGRRTHSSSSATRAHRSGGSAAHGADSWFDGDDVPLGPTRAAARGPRDPFLTRLGLILLAGILLAPLVASTRNDGSAVSGTSSGAAVAIVAPTGATDESGTDTTSAETTSTAGDTTSTAATSAPQPTNDDGRRSKSGSVTDQQADPTTSASTAASSSAATAAPTTASTSAPTTAAAQPGPIARPTPTTAPACALTYDANPGDFWIGIADRAGVELRDLLMANQATVDTALYPGDEICLPAGARNPGPPPTVAPTTQPPATAPPTTKPPTTTPPTTKPPTTQPPTTQPPTTQPPSTGTYTREQVIAIIRDVWPDELEEKAILIATRESNLIPTARNFCCHGLFQMYWNVHKSWLAGIGITSVEQLYNPRLNAIAAYTLYQRAGGWGPWSMTAY
jgi:hypothetical protein